MELVREKSQTDFGWSLSGCTDWNRLEGCLELVSEWKHGFQICSDWFLKGSIDKVDLKKFLDKFLINSDLFGFDFESTCGLA